MRPAIHQYKLRLTNLSQGNRALKLGRLSKRKDFDLTEAAYANKLSSEEILTRIISGKSVDLLRSLSARNEQNNLLDRHLNKLYREVNTIYEETGTDDLFLGYPFVEGKFLDGSIARCPLLLFPVRLVRDFQRSPRWRLEVPKEEDVSFNKTFFLAYEKFQQVRMSPEFWETTWQHFPDIQALLNHLYQFFKEHELQINFNSELFQYQVTRFMDKQQALLENLPTGVLKLQPHAILGIFPQSDSALLQDYEALETHNDQFRLENFFQLQPPPPPPAYVKEDQRYFVTPVDQSQEEALLRIHNGQSVVVHGPPGTGKSQVILNLIADALARGQKVLVCSQKRAALDVVFNRLHSIGLSRFAVLVHDYRGDRSKIFKQIKRQIDDIDTFKAERIDLHFDKWMRDFRLDARKIDDHNRFFDELYDALVKTGRFGLSPHQLYLLADIDVPLIPLGKHARDFDYPQLLRFLDRFRDLLGYLDLLQSPHPWRHHLSLVGERFSLRSRLETHLDQLPTQIEELHAATQAVAFLEEPFHSPEEIEAVLAAYTPLTAQLSSSLRTSDFAAYQAQSLKMTSTRGQLEKFDRIFQRMKKFRILDDFSMLLYQDLAEHFANYTSQLNEFGRFFSLSWLRGRWYLQAILKRKNRSLGDTEFKEFKQEFSVLERLVRLYQELENVRFFADLPLTDTVSQLQAWHARKLAAIDTVKLVNSIRLAPALKPRIQASEFDSAHWDRSLRCLEDLKHLAKKMRNTLSAWRSWLHPQQIERLLKGLAQLTPACAYAQALKDSLGPDFEDLRGLDYFLKEFSAAEKSLLADLQPQLDAVVPGQEAELVQQLKNSFFLSWIELTEAQQPVLLEVSSRRMPRKREDFRLKVRERQERVVELILQKLKEEVVNNIEYNRLKNPVTYREIGHQVSKQRLLWSVRRLIRSFWDEGLNRLMPCWLASPESVAAVFPMKKDYFDLVIFDEASQCYVERALPVILRGRHCVIAGDDKQLPPFDMYSVKVEEEEAPFVENEMALEVESVLDLARNVFAESKLMWHYRSQEEELINFSNHAFYEGRLNIIPPAEVEPEFMPPIEFLSIEGEWQKNRNLKEAERVVALVEELVQRADQPSIGIVTFNYYQKELIRDLLERRLQALNASGDTALFGLLSASLERQKDEEYMGIFVKNIENVQGDERDIIIFSVGYARNAKGKLVSNFGLLSQKGGENRLNVAITRARKKVYVLCSFDPATLPVEDAKHSGPMLFKRYLQYAQAISQGQDRQAQHLLESLSDKTSPETPMATRLPTGNTDLAERVFRDLEREGLQVRRNIGDTNYQVDMAIVDAEGRFLLGVECEGKNYFNGRSSKEREVYRHNLLEQRGWRVHRVWARNYFMDRTGCIAEIVRIVEDANS